MRIVLPVMNIANGFTGDETPNDSEPRLPDIEEDALVKETTAGFSNFVISWFHRVITLMENLPEEGMPGTRAGGEEEGGATFLKIYPWADPNSKSMSLTILVQRVS
jgi:hypothetical protein